MFLNLHETMAQTFTIRSSYSCTIARVSVGYTVTLPNNTVSTGVTSATGDINWTIQSGDPAGTYFVQLEAGIGSAPTSFSTTKGGANVNAFFTVATPGTPNFKINNFAAGNNSAILLSSCSGALTSPVTNTSNRTAFIGNYRFTVFNSSAAGVPTTQVSQTAWLAAFPATVTLPAATGQFLVVRLEVQNTCGTTSTFKKDAFVRWSTGVAPTTFQIVRSNANCTQTNEPSNPNPAFFTKMSPALNAIVQKLGNNFTQYRVEIQECTTLGVPIGALVANKTITNSVGDDISATTFINIFGGTPIWMTQIGSNPWVNANSTKNWRMALYFNSPGCGWTTTPSLHFFKINTACNWDQVTNSGSQDRAAQENPALDFDLTHARVVPNPVSERFQLELPDLTNQYFTVELFDLTGKRLKIYQSMGQDAQISVDVSGFSSALYFYNCKIGEQQLHGKFLKL
jgi:Secretion system C-terminal sorting domain